jgi:hypothetical protein
MSFLAPLYILGALAVAAPIVFHLIRRTPKGEVPFSSLMFLSPTPPRLTRRSRLEHWFLLLLRAAALGLLAFAFARPFLRQAASLDAGEVEQRRIAVLVDTSASMRRGDLWARARAAAGEAIDACRPGDQLSIIAFDTEARPLMGFAESGTLDPARRRAVARSRLEGLAPTWRGTDLGQALTETVAAIEDVADATEKVGRMPRRIVLISDLQQGSRLDALGEFEWPSEVELELRPVSDDRPNAGLQWLAESPEGDPEGAGRSLRVRVSNDPASRRESFRLAWDGADGKALDVDVPPGESRVVRVERPAGSSASRSLRLSGDAHAFDNTLFLADRTEDAATVLYVGRDAVDDANGLLYYLDRVFQDMPGRTVRVRPAQAAEALVRDPKAPVPLVVLSSEASAEEAGHLKGYAQGGGTLLLVLTSTAHGATLAALADRPGVEIVEGKVDRDLMLGEIAFDHPLFAPFAGAQYNDFTKIHFWKYRRLDPSSLGDARVLARFENGDPAVVEKAAGKGRIVVLASGWAPADSQLARSSKFVPLMSALLEGPDSRPFDATNLVVGAPVPLPAEAAGERVVRKPDGTRVAVGPGQDAFSGTDQPGIYAVDAPGGSQAFAVNLDPAEGRTSPLAVETLEQFGCRLASRAPEAVDPEQMRQLRNAELEGRQKIWRGLIVAAIGILIVETWLAGRLARRRPARAEA